MSIVKSENFPNRQFTERVINSKENFTAPETNVDRYYSRHFERLFNNRKNANIFSMVVFLIFLLFAFTVLFLNIIPFNLVYTDAEVALSSVGAGIILAIIPQIFFKKKIPSTLTPKEERGLQLYLRENNKNFTIQKYVVDGVISKFDIVSGQRFIFVKFDSDIEGIKDKEQKIPVGSDPRIDDSFVGYPVRQRTVVLNYPKIGNVIASDKIIVSKKLPEAEKLGVQDIDILIRRDKSGKHYEVRVN